MMHFTKYRNYIVLITIVILAYPLPGVRAQRRTEIPDSLRIQYTIDEISLTYKKTETLDKNATLDILSLHTDQIFKRTTFEEDRLRVKKYYFDNGFFDALIDTSTEYDTENETVIVNFIIIENERYTLDKIVLLGLNNITPEVHSTIEQSLTLKTGEYYDRTTIISETGKILSTLQDNGYFYANLDTADGILVSKYPSTSSGYRNKVNLQISFIGTEKQYRFGTTRIKIADNKYQLQDIIISRELAYKQGDLYGKTPISISEKNFSNISLVQSGRILVDSVFESTGIINFLVNITLNKKYEITPNLIAVDIDNQLFGGAGILYSDRNFFGGGRTFQLGTQGLLHSRDVNRIDISSTVFQPYLFNYRVTGTYNLKFIYYNFDKSLQFITVQNLVRFNYFIAPYTFYNSAYSDITLDLLRTKYKETVIIGTDTSKAGTITNQMNSIIGLTIVHDNTNDVFSPTKGSFHSITVENAGLLPRLIGLINSNITYSQYFKFYVPNRFFWDMTGSKATSIFATQIKLGDIIEYGRGPNIVPVAPLYRFFSGGSSSLRGWNAKENGILDFPEAGGTFLFEGSMEIRWTVYFLDYGNVWEKDKDFRLNQIALAIGLGLRYETFIGPLRLDLGFKLYDPSASENNKWLYNDIAGIFKNHKFAVQFGLGNAF
jgi:outer membrane protein assembly factor BamA